jgi:hypothetical protein
MYIMYRYKVNQTDLIISSHTNTIYIPIIQHMAYVRTSARRLTKYEAMKFKLLSNITNSEHLQSKHQTNEECFDKSPMIVLIVWVFLH